MKVWCPYLPDPFPVFQFLHLGSYHSCNRPIENSEQKRLIEVRTQANLPLSVRENDAFFIPAGAFHLELFEALAQTQCLIYIAVNGLADQAFHELKLLPNKKERVFVFEGDNCNKFDYWEQLGWLASQNHSFAIASEDREQLLTACILKPEALILKKSYPSFINELEYLCSITQPQAPKPLAEAELDALNGSEMGLVVTKDLPAGHLLTNEDITTAITARRGLGQHLRQKIIGKQLGYSLKAEEPITFGYLRDPHYAK